MAPNTQKVGARSSVEENGRAVGLLENVRRRWETRARSGVIGSHCGFVAVAMVALRDTSFGSRLRVFERPASVQSHCSRPDASVARSNCGNRSSYLSVLRIWAPPGTLCHLSNPPTVTRRRSPPTPRRLTGTWMPPRCRISNWPATAAWAQRISRACSSGWRAAPTADPSRLRARTPDTFWR